ncbi:class I SAM-dependent methyltransferase [Virgibacillus salinus]|uniref:UbiE/COQ5 methyltransferase family protein n=1 Tax=Virgibacillus salinus TaxID=553311 RepID=A0A1H1DSH3_9BACI|nr:methyltransferase domain-containing protein [Virgibacillus salinus]SDQ79481.1 ubiE/COQ5 methyltransferase family protein [Virgibacillus salinus]
MSDKRFNPNKADKLLSEERKESLKPNKIIDKIGIRERDRVADLGAGNGFFTIPIAERTNEVVYAVDIESQMLKLLEKRADEQQIENIQYIVSDLEGINLKDDSVNKVLVAFVIHEVESIKNALNEIKRILKPGGEIMIIEWEAIETKSGPPLNHRISSTKMMDILRNNDFKADLIPLNDTNYAVKAALA